MENPRGSTAALEVPARPRIGSASPAGSAEQRLLYLSYCDELTGLKTRRLANGLIDAAIHRAAADGELVAVVMTDIENFRGINDRFGFAGGDAVLREIAQRLVLRASSEDLAIRIGSDIFCLVITGLRSIAAAHATVAAVLEDFGRLVRVGEELCRVGGRLGCALFPQHGGGSEALLRNAELALAAAKQQPSPALRMFNAADGDSLRELAQIEADLQDAVASGALQLHYQPQLDAAAGRIVGAEALLRWRHERLGWIPPAVFVPLAERAGSILAIGDWVVRSAVRHLAECRAAGHRAVPISVNLSARQLAQPNFLSATLATLAEAEVPAELFKLELTETALIEDLVAAASLLGRFKDAGIATALDDFGTGNSSLSLLFSLPLSTLKIDKSFIDHIDCDARAQRIVDASLGLAKSLDMEVVVEGVERRGQVDWLLGRGNPVQQGFYFSRPIPRDALIRDWLTSK